ncbi:MAG: RpiB/LacA/LacB family sugar-phosphate isomerase, partial [Candidatus Paceibacterota bacterium]
MKIYFAADHAGFEMKEKLLSHVKGLGYEVEDCGAYEFDQADDYPDFVKKAAQKVSENPESTRAIIIGASGQGEAMVANRFPHVRAALYYGPGGRQKDSDGKELTMTASTRKHNDANVLALAARFLPYEEAEAAVEEWLKEP